MEVSNPFVCEFLGANGGLGVRASRHLLLGDRLCVLHQLDRNRKPGSFDLPLRCQSNALGRA